MTNDNKVGKNKDKLLVEFLLKFSTHTMMKHETKKEKIKENKKLDEELIQSLNNI